MGIYGTVFSIGTIAGPALLEFTGTRGWQPFVIGAVGLVVTMLPLTLLGGGPTASEGFTPLRKLKDAVHAAPLIMLAALVAGLVESADLTLLPLFGLHAGFTERAALLLLAVFMAGNVVLQVPIGLLADRFGRRFMLGDMCAVERPRAAVAAAVLRLPVAAMAFALHLGRHAVRLLQPGGCSAGRRVWGAGSTDGKHAVRHGLLPGWGDWT